MLPEPVSCGIVETLERELSAINAEEAFSGLCATLPDLDEAGRADLAEYCRGRTASIVTSLRDVVMEGDETEAVMMLPGIFLELRFEWSRYNVQIQYQNILRGNADPLLLGRGTVVSMFVRAVEFALTAEHAFWVNRIAADPITSVAARGDTVKRLLALALSARETQKRSLECLEDLGKAVIAGTVSHGMTIAIERAKEQTVAGSDKAIVIRPSEIHDILELLIVEKLAGRQLRVVVNQGDVDARVDVLPEVVFALREVVAKWLETLLEQSVEGSATERESLGKSAHLNLRWNLRIVHTRLFFSLEDDGRGTAPTIAAELPDPAVWAHLRLRIASEQTPGQGGKIMVTCEASSFSSFLICGLKFANQTSSLHIAVVTTSVLSVLSRVHRVVTSMPLMRMPDGSLIPIVDLCEAWPTLDLSPAQDSSVFLVLATERFGSIALRVDDIPEAVRAAVLTNPSHSHDVVGFVSLKEGLAIVVDPDRLAYRVNAPETALPPGALPIAALATTPIAIAQTHRGN